MRTKASTWRNENHFYDWLPISSAFQNHHHQRQHRLQKNRVGVPVSLPRYRSVFRRLVRMLYHAVGAHRHRLISAVLVVVAVTTLISWRALVPRGDGPRDHGELVREAQMNAERARLMQYPWGTYLRRKAVNVWSELTTSMTCLHRAVEDGRRDRENGFEGWKQSCQEGLASSTWPITAEARQSDFCEDVARVPERLRVFRVPKPAGVGWRDMFLNVLPYMENSHAVEYVLYNHFGSSESIFNTGIEDEANAFLFPAQPYLEGIAHLTYVDGARNAIRDRSYALFGTDRWERFGGCDFFAPSMWDQGRGMFWHADNRGEGLMRNVTVITARTGTGEKSAESTRFNLDQDISAVAIYENHVAEAACRNERRQSSDVQAGSRAAKKDHGEPADRDGLLFFAGSVHKSQRLRQKVMQYFASNPEEGVVVTSASIDGDEYTRKMLSSKYCLQLAGYANLSPRVSEYTLLGCIPVVVVGENSAQLVHPLHRVIDWASIVVQVPEEDLSSLTGKLREEVRDGTYARRVRMARAVRKMLTYHPTPVIGDATWMTAFELVGRIEACKLGDGGQV